MAKLAWRCFEEETMYSVAAFCVDDECYVEHQFCDLPVIPSSKLYSQWPTDSCYIFVALGYQNMNKIRKNIFDRFSSLGYDFASCLSSRAFILNEGNMGKNCFVMEGAILQPFSSLGDNCVCWSGCVVSHESHIGNHCFLAAHSVVGGMATIGDYCFIGMNSTIRDAVCVGEKCLIGAGSLVLADLHDDSLVAEKATPVSSCNASEALRFIDI